MQFTELVLMVPLDRVFDNTERVSIGFDEEMDVMEAYKHAWGSFSQSQILPRM